VVEVIHQRGSVAELHALDPFGADVITAPQVWWCDPTDSALVLGSRQSPDLVDLVAASAAGLNVARRRSGGGAVIVRAHAVVWIDVVVPHGFAPDDIRGAMVWLGEHWLAALRPLLADDGHVAGLEVHRGGMLDSAWSDLVCFAGIGPGEVLIGGRKLVGLSQRRTRHGLRMQGMVYREPQTACIANLLLGDLPDLQIVEPVVLPGLRPEPLARALAALLM
jgi:lipoate---protein ligase